MKSVYDVFAHHFQCERLIFGLTSHLTCLLSLALTALAEQLK